MPEIEVTAEDLARLGEDLEEISAFLAALGRVGAVEPWALGPGSAGDALQEVLGNWEHYRLLLGRHLAALGAGARAAGRGYLRVEADVSSAVGGSGP
jgi:hypothetical protein